jgi:hypothetical protein
VADAKPASPDRRRAGQAEATVALMIFIVGCAGSVLAGVCAYLITLDEMQNHFGARWRAHAEALQQAAVIAGYFVVVSGVLAILLPHLIVNR